MDKTARKNLYTGSVLPGWWDILDKYVSELLDIDPGCNFYVSEKYGRLRVGVVGILPDPERVREIENAAELASSTVCEFCGRPGVLRTDRRWLKTLCDRCATADKETLRKVIEEAEQQWLAKQEDGL